MSEKTQILLLALGLVIIVFEHYFIFKRLDQIERNEEVLRQVINKMNKEKKTNDYKNTNAHYTEKE